MTRLPDLTALWRLNIPRDRVESAREKVRALQTILPLVECRRPTFNKEFDVLARFLSKHGGDR